MAYRQSRTRKSSESLEIQKQLQQRLNYQDDKIATLEKHNVELKKDVASLTAENNALLSRLSRFAGEQMTRGNPDIADLSDPNRPTKLAEKWGSLYTEEWLDAYEELQKRSKRSQSEIAEKQLLEIAVICFHKCKEIEVEQTRKLKEKLDEIENFMQETETTGNDFTQTRRISSARLNRSNDGRFSDNIINSFKQRRRKDVGWIQAVVKKCANEYIRKGGVHSKRVLSYVNKCAELCWYMNVNEPSLVIEYESYPGQEIDRNKFNLYNGKGAVVDFIVWPALLMNRGDSLSLLAKGTVQPVMRKPPAAKHLDGVVSPVSWYNKDMRVPSAASMRNTTKNISPKASLKRTGGAGGTFIDPNSIASTSGVNVDVSRRNAPSYEQPSRISRITNPDRLLSSKSTRQEKPIKDKRGFLKSLRSGGIFS